MRKARLGSEIYYRRKPIKGAEFQIDNRLYVGKIIGLRAEKDGTEIADIIYFGIQDHDPCLRELNVYRGKKAGCWSLVEDELEDQNVNRTEAGRAKAAAS